MTRSPFRINVSIVVPGAYGRVPIIQLLDDDDSCRYLNVNPSHSVNESHTLHSNLQIIGDFLAHNHCPHSAIVMLFSNVEKTLSSYLICIACSSHWYPLTIHCHASQMGSLQTNHDVLRSTPAQTYDLEQAMAFSWLLLDMLLQSQIFSEYKGLKRRLYSYHMTS